MAGKTRVTKSRGRFKTSPFFIIFPVLLHHRCLEGITNYVIADNRCGQYYFSQLS